MQVLLIGLGSIAKKHLPALFQLVPACTVYALRSREDAPAYGGVSDIYDWAEVPKGIDFILISNPTASHAETLFKAIELSVPIFIEKPVLDSLQQAPRLAATIQEKHIKTYVGCNLRFHPCLRFVKAQNIDLHKVNEVNIYCGSYLPDWRPGQDFRKVYSANKEMGGGVHLDLIHELDYCTWLLGQPLETSSTVRAESSLDISASDYAHYVLKYRNFTAAITLNYFRRDSKRQMEIVMDDGTMLVNLLSCTVHFNNELIFQRPDFKSTDTYLLQMEYFIDNLKSGTPYMNDFDEACQVLEVALN